MIVYVLHTRRILTVQFDFQEKPGYTIHGVIGSGPDQVVLDGETSYRHTIEAKVGMKIGSIAPDTSNEGSPTFVYRDDQGNDKYAIVTFMDTSYQGFDRYPTLDQGMLYYSSKGNNTFNRFSYTCEIDELRDYRTITYIESLDQTSPAGTDPIVNGEVVSRIKINDYLTYSSGQDSFGQDVYFDLQDAGEARPSDPLSTPLIAASAEYTGFGTNYPGYSSYWYPYGYGKADGSQVFYQTRYPEVGDDRYLIFLRNSFPLHFVNPGHNNINSETIKVGSYIDAYFPDESELGLGAGEVFLGWYQEPELINEVIVGENGLRMPGGEMTLYAKYAADNYQVIFRDSFEGNIVSDDRYDRDSCVPESVIDAEFYNRGLFLGWYYMKDQTMVPYDWSIKIQSNLDIFAVWDGDAYQLTYHAGGKTGTVPVDDNHYIGGVYALVKQGNHLSDTDEVFIGWYEATGDHVYYPGDQLRITGDMELRALYAPRDKSVRLTYLNDDLTELGTADYLINQMLRLSNITAFNVTKDGYEFIGWKAEDGTVYQLGKEYLINQNETVIAVWKQNTTPTDPTDPTDPTNPTDPTDPTKPTKPGGGGGGGGGGDNPKPTPSPTDPTNPTNPTEPETTLPPLPTSPGSNVVVDENGRLTELDPDGVPLGYWVQDDNGTWIFESAVPLGTMMPKTGDNGILPVAAVICCLLSGSCALLMFRRRRLR